MKRRVKILAAGAGAVVALVIVAVVVAYANLSRIVRTVIEKEVPGLTFGDLDVGWNHVEVTNVELKRGGRSVFQVKALRVSPSVLSIFSDTLRVSSIEIDAPYVYVVRNADGSLTLPAPERIGEQSRREGDLQATKEGSSTTKIHVDSFKIRDGKGDFVDRSVAGAPASFKLTDLDVTVEDVNVPTDDRKIPFALTARLDGKRVGTLQARGWYVVPTQSADVQLNVADLFVPLAEPYYRGRHTTAQVGDGVLALASAVKMADGGYDATVHVSLGDLAFKQDGLFLGVPTPVFKKVLEKRRGPFQFDGEFKGNLKDKRSLRDQVVAALLAQVAKEAAEDGLLDAAKALQAPRAGGFLNSLFGK